MTDDSQLLIYNSKAKVTMLLLINVAFIFGAIWLIAAGYDGLFGAIVGWLCIAFFPFILLLQLRRYLTKEPLVKTDQNGVYLSTYGFIPWSDVTGYAEYKAMIQIYINNEEHYINKLPAPERMIANLNKKFGFSSIIIPMSCCTKEQKTALANALNKRIPL